MRQFNPMLYIDGYKCDHRSQYPTGTTRIYSNLTPRRSRVPGVDFVVTFGAQYFAQEYLCTRFREDFFEQPKAQIVSQYQRRMDTYLGPGAITADHIADLHDLGYLPLHVKALPEGLCVPMRVPVATIENTLPEFFWLTNYLETLMSNILWLPSTSATTAFLYRQRFETAAARTGADRAFVKWQGHDFSFRGLAGVEAALLSAAGHLLSFTGTDTVPAIDFLEAYYGANAEVELVGGSVPATEHSVMCMGSCENERATIRRLITQVYPKGIVSIVSDTWDFWKVLTMYLPDLKAEILGRDGKLVVRPDSGDPVKIICGDPQAPVDSPAYKGAIQVLWDTFGGTLTPKGFKVLNGHVGLIYGDAITLARQEEILRRLEVLGFASSNVVLGIGSFTYQYVTRDTYGFAMKATYGETRAGGPQDIYKDPATDDGTKKSACGLLRVDRVDGVLTLKEGVTQEEADGGLLQTGFYNGHVANTQTLAQIRARVEENFA